MSAAYDEVIPRCSLWKGTWPDSMVYCRKHAESITLHLIDWWQEFEAEITRMTPRLQRSQDLSYPARSKSSGAAYCSVKQGVCRGALPAGHSRANPKSITFSTESSPSSANSTFWKVNKKTWWSTLLVYHESTELLLLNTTGWCVPDLDMCISHVCACGQKIQMRHHHIWQ